jgi:predicted phosphoribosyltransferase
LRALRQQSVAQLVLAIPVGPRAIVSALERECDQVVVLATPEPFWAVGQFYTRFEQTEDRQVMEILEQAASSANS